MNSSENPHGRARAEHPVALGDPPQQRERERDRELGGRAREHVGRVRDDDAARAGGGEVDVVHADAVVRDDLQLRPGGVEVRVVDGRRQQHEDAVGARGLRRRARSASRSAASIAAGTGPVTWTRGRPHAPIFVRTAAGGAGPRKKAPGGGPGA